MSGEHFAFIYDYLMEDVAYDRWIDYARERLPKEGVIADLGCGTGTMLLRLLELGYEVIGIDISQDMLTVADNKLRANHKQAPLFQQDMRDLSGLSQLDGVTIFLDGINYLKTEEDVCVTFSNIHKALRSGGVFLFDVHSIKKLEEDFHNELYGENDELVSYLWFTSPGQESYSVEHEFSFFVKNEADGRYERFDDMQQQRTFPVETYTHWLEEVGFHEIEVTSHFGQNEINGEEDRIFFRAVKK